MINFMFNRLIPKTFIYFWWSPLDWGGHGCYSGLEFWEASPSMLGYAQASCFEISARVLDTGVVFQDPEFALFSPQW